MLLEPHCCLRRVINMAAGEGATLCTERATLPVDQYQPVRHGLCAYLWGVLCSVCTLEHSRGCCVVTNLDSPNDGRTGWPIPSHTETSGGRSSRIHLFGTWKFLFTYGPAQINTLSPFKSPRSVCSSLRLYPKLQLPVRCYEQNVNNTHLFPLLVSGPSQYHSINHTSRKSKLY